MSFPVRLPIGDEPGFLKKLPEFKRWLAARGASLLEPTNEYELLRYAGDGKTAVVYQNKKGRITLGEIGARAWSAFVDPKLDPHFRIAQRGRSKAQAKRSVVVTTLIKRDGNFCFYCGDPFTDALPPTKEHLVPRTSGGPDHISNLFLACEPCNAQVGHAPAAEKIRFRDRKRRGAGTLLLIELRPHVEALSVSDDDPEFKALLGRLDKIIHHNKETTNGK